MPALQAFRPVMVLSLLLLGLQLLGPENLRYDAASLQAGELWRWISGHLVHANPRHLLLNLVGLWLCQALTGVPWKLWQWLWRILLLAAAISLGFWLFDPQIHWYVGFSGVLFGLYLLAALDRFWQQPLVSVLLIGMLVVKILMEQFASVKIDGSGWIGVPVLVDAHLYGFVAALLLAMAQGLYQSRDRYSA